MSPRHRLSLRLLDHAVRVMPASRRAWAAAMRAELHHIPGPWAAAGFALGCVRASYTQRIADMMTFARLARWTLAGLALAWAGFCALAAGLLSMIKASPGLEAADLGSDPGTGATLAYVQAYPAWELAVIALLAVVLAAGAVQLARRRPLALGLLVLGVGVATALAFLDLRLPDPGADRPLGSVASLILPLLGLIPAWWLSRRAPDLTAAR